jgi:adenosylcobinamide-GDP ribazoletransferase
MSWNSARISSKAVGCGMSLTTGSNCAAQSRVLDSSRAVLHVTSMDRLLADLAACLRFYTRLPLPVPPDAADSHAMPDFAGAAGVVPLAGALIGVLGALVLAVATNFGIAPLPAATIAIGALVVITGAIHEDGLADLCDGFGGGADRERKLEIMRDSRLGTYGVAALVLSLLLRVGTLAGLIASDLRLAAAVLVAVAAVSRTAGLLPLLLLPPARTSGAGFAAARPAPETLAAAVLLSFVFACLPLLAGANLLRVLAACVVAGLAAYAISALARRQIGGQTGDIAGGAQQAAEIAMLLVFAAGATIAG